MVLFKFDVNGQRLDFKKFTFQYGSIQIRATLIAEGKTT